MGNRRINVTTWALNRLAPLLSWIGVILWIASRPRSFFFLTDTALIFGVPRHLLQHPYHLGAYFVLAILFARCVDTSQEGTSTLRAWAVSGIGCLAVAVGAELIQLAVPTRSAALRDVVVDLVGATLGTWFWRRRAHRSGRGSTMEAS